jgi:long-chain fatty acid transport protein
MRYSRLASLCTLLSPLFFCQTAFAAAFQFYELGTPSDGTAGVGQAVLSDASTAYFNPAGMARLSSSQYMLGAQAILPYINFSKSTRTTIAGDNGGNAGTLTPGLDLYYVYSFSPKWKFGVSFTAPYGGSLNYNDGWVGRYSVQYLMFYALNLNPAISYTINDWAAVGAGASVEYAYLQQTIALPLPVGVPFRHLIDGQVNLKTYSFAPGVNVGVYLTPTASTKIGVTYRSRITHHLRGTITFLRLGVTPSATTSMVMPQNVIVSASQDVTNQFTLLGEAGWAAWSSMKDTVVNVAGFSATTPLNWHDTYRVGVAGQYKPLSELVLQAGASFDSSPTSSSLRTTNLPMDNQLRLGAGLTYALRPSAKIGFSYEYIYFGNANINNNSTNGMLVGSYSRNYANVVQASINVDC